MLQSIRDKTQGWIAGIIVSILILSFALWGIHSYLNGDSANAVVAKVNGVEITKSQLAVAYERLRRQVQAQLSSSSYAVPENVEASLKNKALETLIDIQVLKQASLKQKYRVSDHQVDNLLESMPEFQVNGQFSLNRFQEVLSTTLFNANDFFELLKTSLLIDQPRLGILFTSIMLPDEVTAAIALVNQERNMQYAILTTQNFLNKPLEISNEEINAYYESHQVEFNTPEQVNIEYVELSLKNLMSALHLSDTELKRFYNENSNAFAEPMQWKLAAIFVPLSETATEKDVTDAQNKVADLRQKINKGTSFDMLAAQYPTGKMGEKLQGWLTLNKIPQELQKTVVGLNKAGQVSMPVRIANGFILIKASDIKEAKILPFDRVKDKVRETVTRQQAEEKFAELRDKLASMTYEHPDSLQSAAEVLGLQIQSSELFTKEKGGKDISSHNNIREAAFTNDVLNLKNNSDVIQLGSDSAIVIRVKTHVPATLLTLKAVEKQISDKLKLQKADELGLKQAIEIKDKLANGEGSNAIAAEYHFSWNQAGFITRHAKKIDPAILNAAFAMPKPAADKPVYATVKVANGYAIVAVSDVKDGKLSNKESYDVFAEQIQNSQGLLEYELYKGSLIKQSKIVVNS